MLDALRQIIAGLAMTAGVYVAWPLVFAPPSSDINLLFGQAFLVLLVVFAILYAIRWTFTGIRAAVKAMRPS